MKLSYHKQARIVKRRQKGLSSAYIAKQFGLSRRRIEQVWAYWQINGDYLPLSRPGRKPIPKDDEKLRMIILGTQSKTRQGATYIAKYLRDKLNIRLSHNYIHNVLLREGLALPNSKKQKRRKPWVRYERTHSLSAVHMDWHFNSKTEKWVCVVLDDASRKILAGGEYDNSVAEHCIDQIKESNKKYGHIRKIREVITDHGPQFFVNKKSNDGTRGKTKFQEFLEGEGIKHILCRYKHPQTNGKIEKWFHCYEMHRHAFSTFEEFIQWYNNIRPHGSLDFHTPEEAFWYKLRGCLLGRFLKWAEK